ncbi:MAG: T9SS type A sorting domain-containing protein [Balneolaceae bacterium]
MNYNEATGGSAYSTSAEHNMWIYDVSGLSNTYYRVKRKEVRKNISYSYLDEPNVWCRGVESTGWNKEVDNTGSARNYGQGFCEPVSGTITNTGATLRTYIYEVWQTNYLGQRGPYIGKFPTNENNVEFAYTVHGKPGTPSNPPSTPTGTVITNATNRGSPKIDWNDNPENDINHYEVWRQQKRLSDGFIFQPVQIGSPTSSNYTDPFVIMDYQQHPNDWRYAVKAVNNNNESSGLSYYTQWVNGNTPFKKMVEISEKIPETFSLQQNYPNPFNPTTHISYALPEAAEVTITVYNIMGQQVATLVNTSMSAGFHELNFDAGSLSSGMYLARMQAIGQSGVVFSKELKMQLVK